MKTLSLRLKPEDARALELILRHALNYSELQKRAAAAGLDVNHSLALPGLVADDLAKLLAEKVARERGDI